MARRQEGFNGFDYYSNNYYYNNYYNYYYHNYFNNYHYHNFYYHDNFNHNDEYYHYHNEKSFGHEFRYSDTKTCHIRMAFLSNNNIDLMIYKLSDKILISMALNLILIIVWSTELMILYVKCFSVTQACKAGDGVRVCGRVLFGLERFFIKFS